MQSLRMSYCTRRVSCKPCLCLQSWFHTRIYVSDPDFILVGLGALNKIESKLFELIPWSEEAKSGEIQCTVPADTPSNMTQASVIGEYK